MTQKIGLVLSGGGARGAFQAGVLQALVEISQSLSIRQPFPIVTGVSAGAINAAYWACYAHDPALAVRGLAHLWGTLETKEVFQTDIPSLGKIALNLISDLSTGSLLKKKRAKALLNTAPLGRFLAKHVPFSHIQKNIEGNILDAVGVTATDYSSSQSITFVHSREPVPSWERIRRKSETVYLTSEHVMGSAAIPFFFPAVRVGDRYFGDGCLRNMAPLSPAIHLGAQKLIVVGVRKQSGSPTQVSLKEEGPSLARIASVIINSLFFDATDLDVERMSRINRTLAAIPKNSPSAISLQPIDYLWLQPSEDISEIAFRYHKHLPKAVRYLLSGLGSLQEASDLLSYLLFEPHFCRHLLELGHRDGLNRRDEIEKFLSS